MSEIPDWLAENYRELARERGTTLEQLAAECQTAAPDLAAWMRAEYYRENTAAVDDTPDAAPAEDAAPIGRRAAKPETADAAEPETA